MQPEKKNWENLGSSQNLCTSLYKGGMVLLRVGGEVWGWRDSALEQLLLQEEMRQEHYCSDKSF